MAGEESGMCFCWSCGRARLINETFLVYSSEAKCGYSDGRKKIFAAEMAMTRLKFRISFGKRWA